MPSSIDVPSTTIFGLSIPAIHIGGSLLILIGILLVVFIIFAILKLGIQAFVKFLINALIGAAMLYVSNYVFGEMLDIPQLTLPINWLTTSVAGLLGIPGFIIMLILNAVI